MPVGQAGNAWRLDKIIAQEKQYHKDIVTVLVCIRLAEGS
jgi:hypothetical protein